MLGNIGSLDEPNFVFRLAITACLGHMNRAGQPKIEWEFLYRIARCATYIICRYTTHFLVLDNKTYVVYLQISEQTYPLHIIPRQLNRAQQKIQFLHTTLLSHHCEVRTTFDLTFNTNFTQIEHDIRPIH